VAWRPSLSRPYAGDQRESLKVKVVGAGPGRRLATRARNLRLHQFRLEQTADSLRDPVLNSEEVLGRRLDRLGPEMRPALHIDKPRLEPHPASPTCDSACQRIARAAHVCLAVVGGDAEPARAGKRAERRRVQALREIVLRRIAAHVAEPADENCG
jgi:hypothetical protein